jgi:hypothetical protein
LNSSTSPFCIGYFSNSLPVYAWAGLDCDPPTCVSLHSWVERHTPLHPATGWDVVSRTFCPGWPWNLYLPNLCFLGSWDYRLSRCTWPTLDLLGIHFAYWNFWSIRNSPCSLHVHEGWASVFSWSVAPAGRHQWPCVHFFFSFKPRSSSFFHNWHTLGFTPPRSPPQTTTYCITFSASVCFLAFRVLC